MKAFIAVALLTLATPAVADSTGCALAFIGDRHATVDWGCVDRLVAKYRQTIGGTDKDPVPLLLVTETDEMLAVAAILKAVHDGKAR